MNRIDRLTSIILMLQSHRVVTADKLAERFEISARTVYRDIAALGEAGVPIVAEAGVGYSMARGYNVPPVMFTEAETAALFMSGEITEQFGDESLKKSLSGALLKVRSVLPADHQDYLTRLGDSLEVWSKPNGLRDERSLMPIQESVVRKRRVALTYDAGGRGELTERTVDPLGLVFYGSEWHLIAWCRLREAIRDFRLDRMTRWRVLAEMHSGHEDFSLANYLKKVDEEHALLPVRIECERWAFERARHEMPCQITSTDDLADGRLMIEARAYSLDWLARWLVGTGGSAVAHGPAELRAMVAEKAERIVRAHA